jgi:nucleoside-diphosphate-sugar epimerase
MAQGPYLILGATGSVGGGIARELLARGLAVRALVRDPAAARARFGAAEGLEWIGGDATDRDRLVAAARGTAAIVHGVNYPYHLWRPHMVDVTANVVASAAAGGAAILFPGNVYGLGRQTGRPLGEDAPMQPCSRKGALRVELEAMLRAASETRGVRVLVLRAGDYYGPTVRNGLVDRIFGRALQGRRMQTFGRLDVAHQWAYMPDLARAAVDLMLRAEAPAPFEVVHFRGHVADPARGFLSAVATAAGHPGLGVQVLPWWLLRLAGLADPVVRELLELRYLWDESVILSGDKLGRLLPDYRDTPLQTAIAETLRSYRALTP